MVSRSQKRTSADIDQRRVALSAFRRTTISLAVAAALPGFAALPAFAQEGEEQQMEFDEQAIEEIVVTSGRFRQSVIDSIGTKRNSTSIVEAISAEDIGKLPDSSIAEAISRLPGLAGQRLDGRTSSISIRGLGEDFSTATLNGREQVSISDNRGVEFDVYPSEVMSGVTVHKTPDASLTTQGIGGTINLHTVKPLDYDRTIQFGLNLEQNDFDKLNPDGDDSGWRGNFSYIDQFADDRVGVALAVAKMDSPNQEERWNSWGFPTNDDGDLVLGGAKPFVRSSTLDRDTIMGVIEFEPTDTLRITADGLYIDFEDEKILRGIEMPGAFAQTTDSLTVQDGLVTQGVWQDVRGQIRNDFELRQAELRSAGLNIEFDVSDTLTLAFDASHSDVDRNIWSLESYSGSGRSSDATAISDDIAFTMEGSAEGAVFTPTLDYNDDSMFQLGGAQGWGNGVTVPNDAQDGFINFPHVDDKLNTFRLSADKAIDRKFLADLEFGVYFADREKAKFDRGVFLTLPDYPDVASVPDQYRLPDTSLDFIGMGQMISYDSFGFWQDGNYTETSENLTVPTRSLNTWVVNEEVTIGYAMAEFDTTLGDLQVAGNFGAQIVRTDQSSDGFAVSVVGGFVEAQPVSGGATFTEVLPSANAIFFLTDQQQIRAGVARTMSRSRMDRMNASFGFTFNPAFNTANANIQNSPWMGNGANPELRPQMADQIDVSYEYYFRDDGYLAAALFYKDLKDWQVPIFEVVDFSGVTPPGGQVALFDLGLVQRWENSEGGNIEGIELQTAVPWGMFADALEGFGTLFSATFLDSSIDIEGVEISVPGLSDTIFNLTLFYEYRGFEVRVSGNKRDEFIGEVNAISFSRELVNVKDTEVWDAQLSYSFDQSGFDALEGLTLTFQAQNLTNEPFTTFSLGGDPRQVRDFQNYGRNYLLGARYRF